jgi:sugar lactone lactonase YvrE
MNAIKFSNCQPELSARIVSQNCQPVLSARFVNLLRGIIAACTILLTTCGIKGQNLFVADSGGGNIYEYTNFNGTLSSNSTLFASGLNQPYGLAFNSAGDLFVANSGSGNIVEITPSGAQTAFAGGLNQPAWLAFDKSNNLFVANYGSGDIIKITPNAVESTFATGVNSQAVTFDSSGNLFAANYSNGKIYEFTNSDGTLSSNSTVYASVFGVNTLAFDSKGNLFVSAPSGVTEITSSGMTNVIVPDYFYSLAINNDGILFATGNSIIHKITVGGVVSDFAAGPNVPEGLVFQSSSLPPPPLSIVSANNQITVFWPSSGANYSLQSTTNLSNPNWAVVTNGTPIVGVTITNPPASEFFRIQ